MIAHPHRLAQGVLVHSTSKRNNDHQLKLSISALAGHRVGLPNYKFSEILLSFIVRTSQARMLTFKTISYIINTY